MLLKRIQPYLLTIAFVLLSQCGTGLRTGAKLAGCTAAASSANQIEITWADISLEKNYVLEYSVDGSTNWTQVSSPSENAVTASHSGLNPATRFYYRLKGQLEERDTDYVSCDSFTLANVPTDLFAAVASSSEIALGWTDVSGETGYEIQVSDDNSTWSDLSTSVAGNAVAYVHSGLGVGVTKYYRIRAVNPAGASAYSSSVNATTTTAITATYSGTSFSEAGVNNGSITQTRTVTLANDTFAAVTFDLGDEYTISAGAVPSGLSMLVSRSSATQLTVSFTGNASAHANSDDTSFTLSFQNVAFTSGGTPATGSSQAFTVDFADVAAHTVFVSSTTYNANFLSGFTIAFADTECAALAASAGFSVFGWKALLSTDLVNARDRITITGTIFNTNNEKVADDSTDLWDGSLDNAVGYTEGGNATTNAILTGSNSDGTVNAGQTCISWTVFFGGNNKFGIANRSNSDWIAFVPESAAGQCVNTTGRSIYCIK